jgi:hypothetical protein
MNKLILPRQWGKSRRNRTLHRLAMANGWEIELVGGAGEPYQGAGLTEPVYYDECPEDVLAFVSTASKPQTPKPPSKKKAGRKSKGAKLGRP